MDHHKCPVDMAADAVGGAAKLAALVGVSPQAISNWKERGIPIERCVAVERLTGVSRRELRPTDWLDHWPELALARGGKSHPKTEQKAA